MDPFTIALGVQGVGAVASWWNRQGQADEVRSQTAEELRRFKAEAAKTLGSALASGAASGIEADSTSLQGYLAGMETEFQRQAEWMARAGSRRASSLDTAANIGLFSDLSSGLFGWGKDNNWWRKPAATGGVLP